ncbi:uncharacterized protein LOC118732692 [Rhagoletis pomonella]|uniref:uncharacterized protein LOC118732692 n=1 Tax=Rhagoletis pomonella TaxID=28610 RepID=UPI0017859AE2|nr:uncharacterized protein LOC118732692 [Rhagoletis pomonella]
MVEGWHRTLKSAILCHSADKWTTYLPLILLGLRSTFKEDLSATPAELVYGTTLRLPSEFFDVNKPSNNEHNVITEFRRTMNDLRPTDAAWHTTPKVFVHPDIKTCGQVFVRDDSVRPSLTAPYKGPYNVLRRTSKYYVIKINNKEAKVSIDRLKPAFTATLSGF